MPPSISPFAEASPISRRALAYKLKRISVFEISRAIDEAARASLTRREQRWLSKISNRLHACAATLFVKLTTPPGEPTVLNLSHKRACHKAALCSICARYRSRKLKAKYRDHLAQVLSQANVPIFVMVTFTVPNVPVEEVASQLALLDRAYAKLLRLSRIAQILKGALSATEITVPFDAGVFEAHSHIHAIWALRGDYFDRAKNYYLDQPLLQTLWSRCAEAPVGKEFIVEIHRIKGRDGSVDPHSVLPVLSEILKYQAKPTDLVQRDHEGNFHADAHVVASILKATHKRRAIRATGIFLKQRKRRTPSHPA